MSVKQRLYDRSPVWVQNLAVTSYGYHLKYKRYGRGFELVRRQIEDCRTWDASQVRAYQDARFSSILDRAFDSAYYARTFRTLGISRGDVSGVGDLERLPFLPKDIVRRHGPELISQGSDSFWVQHTSGSTGTPLDVHLNRWTYQLVHGLLADYEQHNGVSRHDLRATFAGRLTQPVSRMTPPFWRYNRAERQLLFSSYHVNDETLPLYLEELVRRQPSEIIGYPSAIRTIAEYVVRTGRVGDVRPRVVITNSETLLAWQRHVIEQAFQCPVRDYYGSAEAVVFAGQCDRQTYHVNPLLGVAEVVDETGAPATEGTLVCTTLTNDTMPLIRYEIGDSATVSSEPCACGCPWTAFRQILGRTDDVIITPDGRHIGRIDHIFKGLHSIRECQVVQETPRLIRLCIVKANEFTEHDQLMSNIRERLGPEMAVELEFVDRIPRAANGKFRGVINRVQTKEQVLG